MPALLGIVGAATAAPTVPPLPPLVGVCVAGVTAEDCWRDDVCVGVSYQVPKCVDVPCYNPVDCISLPDPNLPPLVGVCAAGVTDEACWGGDVCVGVSYQVPKCVDVPCYNPVDCISLPDPNLPPLVSVCVAGVTASSCYRGGTVCFWVSYQVPTCVTLASPRGPAVCMDRYARYDVGPVTVVSRSTCHAEVLYNGEPILQ